MKRIISKLKKWIRGSTLRTVLIFAVLYAVLCYLYWYVEIGPDGSKTYLDILLWNNVNIVLGRGFTDLVPKTWKGRGLLMIFICFSMLFLSTIIGFISSKINANVQSRHHLWLEKRYPGLDRGHPPEVPRTHRGGYRAGEQCKRSEGPDPAHG